MTVPRSQGNADVIIIGAGSIGLPAAYELAKAGLSVLVIDKLPSPGQASNKHAIGGVRATHSDPAKILLGNRSLDIFSNWQAVTGDDIEWRKGGYSFVAYENGHRQSLKKLITWQTQQGLNIKWLRRNELLQVAPGLNQRGLLGGTYSPEDGSASPLKVAFSSHKLAVELGVRFNFIETVQDILLDGDRVTGVRTDKATYHSQWVINAAGGWARTLSAQIGVDVPVEPDSHEAGITEPVAPFFNPMIVDMRAQPGSANFYFYQHPTGKIIFCMTPDPPILGTHTLASGNFLPRAARRLIDLMPILQHIRVRRVWRGTYPMTPDGAPILGPVEGLEGYLLAVGMCGQGFMFGPGIAQTITNLVLNRLDNADKIILGRLAYDRNFDSEELLK
ncbi:MAG: FAD-binding oxidoreductase [Chloroflexota bacterium]|nr:FAD-binding oxidoreductase [Chloroflexota bacterium]